MANKSGKKKKQGILQAKVGRQGYFESGRVKKLPLGKCYINMNPMEEGIISVMITREHINQHVSFAFFVIHSESGEVLETLFDFNFDPDEFSSMLDTFDFSGFEDYYSLQQLVYAAAAKSRQSGLQLPKDFHTAQLILEDAPECSESERTWKKLAFFQIDQDQAEAAPPDATPPQSEPPGGQAYLYDPSEVADWSREKWTDYFTAIKPMKPSERLNQGITPLAYIFEKTRLGKMTISTRMNETLARLSEQKTQLTEEDFKTPTHYIPGKEEFILMNSICLALEDTPGKSGIQQIIKEIKVLMEKYPENPEFDNLLYNCYARINSKRMRYQVAEDGYKKYPNQLDIFLNYFTELILAQKDKGIQRLLAQNYLLEDFFPERVSFDSADYLNYYFMLFQYLMFSGEYEEAWALHKVMAAFPEFKKADIRAQNKWKIFYVYPANFVATLLDGLISTDTDTEKLIDVLVTE